MRALMTTRTPLFADDLAIVAILSHWSDTGSRSVVPGTQSSMFTPTAPAAMTRCTTSAAAFGVAAYPCSMSAVTGTDTARAIRAIASIIS